MNLFVESTTNYLAAQCDATVAGKTEKEVRIFIQSLPPLIAQKIFTFITDRYYSDTLEKHVKVAKGLWDEWERKYPELSNQLDNMVQRGWIDHEDKLTHYRNMSCPAGKSGLIVIIIGLDHATDKGGLSDFHVVRESTIWRQELGGKYAPWIERLVSDTSLPATDALVNALEKFFTTLFQHRHRSLVDLSTFLETELFPSLGSLNTSSELVALAYEKLPFWRIPPLLDIPNHERNGQALLADAATFISHQSFQNLIDRRKAWQKIEDARQKGQLAEVPQTPGHKTVYADVDDFFGTVKSFIDDNDIEAKQKLLKTDLTKLLQVLKSRKKKDSPDTPKPLKYKGPVLMGVLQAIWEALEEFKKGCGPSWAPAQLSSIDVTLLSFKHNLRDDGGNDADEIAERMKTGIIGGLDECLKRVRIDLRGDADDKIASHSVEINYCQSNEFRTPAVRTQPFLEFCIDIRTSYDQRGVTKYLHCVLDDNSEERVRYQYADSVVSFLKKQMSPVIPVFTMQRTFTELFFAYDSDDANRLVREGLSDFEVLNVFKGTEQVSIDQQLWDLTATLASAYRTYLVKLVEQGPYTADDEDLIKVITAYDELTKHLVREKAIGYQEVLARLYKAFFIIPKGLPLSERYLDSGIAIGISPMVAELVHGRNSFLLNGFPQVVAEMLEGDIPKGRVSFERLLGLIEIRRPIAALVQDKDKVLTTRVKSFGMIHCVGLTPGSELSLASQSIMRVDELDDENVVKDLIKPNEESKLISRALADYQRLHPYAHDQLRILVVNIDELQSVLAGVHKFLEQYLKEQPVAVPTLHLYLKVYSKSTSPGAVVNQLSAWRDLWAQKDVAGRGVRIRVGHRYAPTKEKILSYLAQEDVQFDVAFLMHFMDSDGGDDVEPVAAFEFNYSSARVNKFPIVEHPRPIRVNEELCRQTLLSNRRLRLQTCHTQLSARLKHPHLPQENYLVFGMVDFSGWRDVVNEMHRRAQWVVCIDPYVDKRLLEGGSAQEHGRKIVGFAAGLGCYGELNMTVSTEADTLARLTVLVREQFKRLIPDWNATTCEMAAVGVLSESHEISGLSLIKAVGGSEYIRDVVAYAAMCKVLEADPDALITQLIPMDSVRHWFYGADESMRPDLLHLSVWLKGTQLHIHATLIECKLGLSSEAHVAKALDQIKAGLRRLTYVFMPYGQDENVSNFDRRYWWAQLQRTIACRARLNITDPEYLRLNVAFEHLAEGYYTIDWDSVVVTLWTDKNTVSPTPAGLKVNLGTLPHLPHVQETITVRCAEFGKDTLAEIFTTNNHPKLSVSNTLFSCTFANDGPGDREDTGDDAKVVDTGFTVAGEAPETSSEESYPDNTGKAVVVEVNEKHLTEEEVPMQVGSAQGRSSQIPLTQGAYSPEKADNGAGWRGEEDAKGRMNVTGYRVPARILIGTDRSGKEYFWEYGHESLQNRHLLIFGASGSGKTYAIQCLLAELAKHGQNSLIVDYTDGYLPEHLEEAFVEQTEQETHLLVTDPLPINPFRFQTQTIAGKVIRETAFKVASRIASVFTSVYSTIGDQQNAELINTIEAGLDADENYNLEALLCDLNQGSDIARSLANKITPFIKTQPFVRGDSDSWKAIFHQHEGKVHILQLATVARDIQQLITEFTLWDLYDFASTKGNKNLPLPVVLDEVQNLDHRKDSPLEKFLREGRKFGISLILATQTLSNFEQQERDRLFQAAHKLFFAPADTEIKRFADILRDNFPTSLKDEWIQRLSRLQKGECLSIGPAMNTDGKLENRVLELKITSLKERFHG